jgi:predicted pyridoxine 5'-phosphate oxidase superfamily flavin-nucleotide-binding protein
MQQPPASDVAFTPAVKAVQARRGSREGFARMEEKGGFRTRITPELAEFLAHARSFYFATASADGQPYIQHRGGPEGFLHVLDPNTLGFADYAGNRQYITTGNLSENPRAMLFVIDYRARRRVKLWGTARCIPEAAALAPPLWAQLWPQGYSARPEQAILFELVAWDVNCAQHIPRLLPAEDVGETIRQFQARVRELEAEVARLKAAAPPPTHPRE